MVSVALIQINNDYSGQGYLPYSVGLLQSFVKARARRPEDYEFLLPLHSRLPIEKGAQAIAKADVAAFSVYVWNVNLSLAIAKRLRELNSNTVIVFGGPQVPDHAEEFLRQNTFIDLVVHGEGETPFLNILEGLGERPWGEIKSLSFLKADGIYQRNEKNPRIPDYAEETSPYLNGVFEPLIEANPAEKWLAIWETNRGCPFSCTYCDWGSAIQSKVSPFGMPRLEREVDWFARNKIEFVFCADANFGILKRDFEIAKCVVEAKQKYGYPHAMSVQNTKNATENAYQVQKLLATSGLNKAITLSFQSTDTETLKNIKRDNISLKSFQELQRRFTADRIPTYSDIILGLPGETCDSYMDGVATLIEGGQHNRIFFMNLSILPNAEMGDPEYQKRFGIVTIENEVVYIRGLIERPEGDVPEMQKLVIANSSLSREDWVRARAFSWMLNLLHFNKLLQIPFILLNKEYGRSYRELAEVFLNEKTAEFPVLAEIAQFFHEKARAIQRGDFELCPSPEWLGVYWPADEYMMIKLSVEGKLTAFHAEAERRLCVYLRETGTEMPEELLRAAVALNAALIRQPFCEADVTVKSDYNIWEFYRAAVCGEEVPLVRTSCTYSIDRTSSRWENWQDWCREVIWFGSKSGSYLYSIRGAAETIDEPFKLAGHH